MENGPKSKNGKKFGQKIENGPRPEMGEKMAQKWRKNGNCGDFLFFHHFWALFFPVSGRGPFSIFCSIFPVFGFRPIFHAIPGGLTRNAKTKAKPSPSNRHAWIYRQGVLKALLPCIELPADLTFMDMGHAHSHIFETL